MSGSDGETAGPEGCGIVAPKPDNYDAQGFALRGEKNRFALPADFRNAIIERSGERVLCLADAGNGVSSSADLERHVFINTELTVHLHRQPAGEWIGIDAYSVYEPDGVGAAFSVLHDEQGPIGRGAQALYLDTR